MVSGRKRQEVSKVISIVREFDFEIKRVIAYLGTISKALEVFFSHKKKLKEAQGKLLWQEKSNKESFTSSFLPRLPRLALIHL